MMTPSVATISATSYVRAETATIPLRCPRCEGWLSSLPATSALEDDLRQCSNCYAKIACINGIWRALPAERLEYFKRFIADYEFVRTAEGRGSSTSDYYLALPEQDLSGNNTAQWAIRARTFHVVTQRILSPLAAHRGRPLRILDLGAGNGWLSYRLSLLGHSPVAVDLLVNDQDGLGAAVHYKKRLTSLFPRFQAELDRLPFGDGSFDLVIFNASFHYSENYETTMREALRCANRGGMIVIADSPWYSSDESGKAMMEEKKAGFTARYGFPSDSLSNLEYLTDTSLNRLSACFGIRWEIHTPYYGLRWALRPILAGLHGRREPSCFHIYATRVRE